MFPDVFYPPASQEHTEHDKERAQGPAKEIIPVWSVAHKKKCDEKGNRDDTSLVKKPPSQPVHLLEHMERVHLFNTPIMKYAMQYKASV
jgi:hypothetical protein